jgi:hypothetical protein
MRAFSIKEGTEGFLITYNDQDGVVLYESKPYTLKCDQLFMVEDIAFDIVSANNQQLNLNSIEKSFLARGFIGFKSGNPKQREMYTFVVHQSKVEFM